MRNKDFLNQIKPEFDFDSSTTPKAPDYHLLESWVAHPNKYANQFLIPNGKLEQKEFVTDCVASEDKIVDEIFCSFSLRSVFFCFK